MKLKRQIPAILMASGLALAGAACEAENGVEEPGVTDPAVDDGITDDIGGTDDTATP